MKTALAAIHASQSDTPPVSEPSSALLSHGIKLMLDMRGTSDSLLNKLAKEGVCREANVLRHWIKKLARAIDPLDVRSPPPKGMSHVKAWTADNADYHLFHSCRSAIPVANILLGIEEESDTTHFNKTYINGLGKVSDVQPEELAASEYDDKVAQDIINIQNIAALLNVYATDQLRPSPSDNNSSDSSFQPTIGSKVDFHFRSKNRIGTVKQISGKEASIEFSDGGRTTTRSIPLSKVF